VPPGSPDAPRARDLAASAWFRGNAEGARVPGIAAAAALLARLQRHCGCYTGGHVTLDDDDKKWVRDEIGTAKTELREEIAGLRAEMRGGFEGMKEAFVVFAKEMTTTMHAGFAENNAAIEKQTRAIVDAILEEKGEPILHPGGNGKKPPKDGDDEKS
jgi:hypothetical protein